jgi:hypothetical protein
MIRDVRKVGKRTEVDLTCSDLPPQVIDWYMKTLPPQGWRLMPIADVTESGGIIKGMASAGSFTVEAKHRALVSEIRLALSP